MSDSSEGCPPQQFHRCLSGSRHHREHYPLQAQEHGCSAKPVSPEITVLEVLVHFNGVLSVPLVLSSYDVPDGPDLITEVDPAALPEGSGLPKSMNQVVPQPWSRHPVPAFP
jgi:hypothetical protein